MDDVPNKHWPGLWQSIGIAALLVVFTYAIAPLLMLSVVIHPNLVVLLCYLLTYGLPFIIVHRRIRKKSQSLPYDLKLKYPRLIPVIIIATIALHLGLISPVANLLAVDVSSEYVEGDWLEPDLFIFLLFVVFAPLLEEIIFRGVIQKSLTRVLSPAKGIFLTSLLFALVHLNIQQFFTALILGVFIGWIYYRTGDMILAIGIHALNNLVAVLGMFYYDPFVSEPFSVLLLIIREQLLIILMLTVLGVCVAYLYSKLEKITPCGDDKNRDTVTSTESITI